ncbi:MAG: hypothetical protein D6808_05660, partial [Candidatus Dadabacteria bacterium]
MARLRAANISYYTTLPFRLLQNEEFIEYEENNPKENARKLHEGEVDIAHIPITEYIAHGGYVSLDFGVAVKGRFAAISLFSYKPLRELSTIYLPPESDSAVMLLRLLLKERWNCAPHLERLPTNSSPIDYISGRKGALVIGDLALNNTGKFPFETNLSEEWAHHTRLPFVFTVWAARPENLTREIDLKINQTFHKAIAARESLALQYSDELSLPIDICSEHITKMIRYYFDAESLEGMKLFFQKAYKCGLTPKGLYRKACYSVSSGKHGHISQRRSISEILSDTVEGKPISIAEGIRIGKEAELSDLALAADSIRQKIFNTRTLSYAVKIESSDLTNYRKLDQALSKISSMDIDTLEIKLKNPPYDALDLYENFLNRIRKRFGGEIQMLSPVDLISLSTATGKPLYEISGRLIAAGLQRISDEGGEILVDSLRKERGILQCTSVEWIDAVRTFHKKGGKSSCCLKVEIGEGLEEWLLHLYKLRSLQNETNGFTAFSLLFGTGWDLVKLNALKVKLTMVCRLFLNNIPNVQETSMIEDPVMGILNLQFGANNVKIDLNKYNAS